MASSSSRDRMSVVLSSAASAVLATSSAPPALLASWLELPSCAAICTAIARFAAFSPALLIFLPEERCDRVFCVALSVPSRLFCADRELELPLMEMDMPTSSGQGSPSLVSIGTGAKILRAKARKCVDGLEKDPTVPRSCRACGDFCRVAAQDPGKICR